MVLYEMGLRRVRPSWAQKVQPAGIRPVDGGTYKREERERRLVGRKQKSTYVFSSPALSKEKQ